MSNLSNLPPTLSRAALGPRADGPAPGLEVLPQMRLRPGRAHEFCGADRHRLALMVAARLSGPVLWIAPGWVRERLNGDGIRTLIDPARLLFAHPMRGEDLLWCMEEGLRSGAVPLVVAELFDPPGITPVRRLHLAAEAGSELGLGPAPLGLVLTPGMGGAAGVESRWALDPVHRLEAGRVRYGWQLQRLRARTAPPATWEISGAV